MQAPATDKQSPEFHEGLAHLAAGRWDAAVVSLRVAAAREPGRLAIVRALATAYLKVRDAAAARHVCAEFTLNCPMCAESWRLAAQLEWKLNRRPQAVALVARGLDHLPNSPILHRQMALFTGAAGDIDRSARHAEQARDHAGRVGQYVSTAAGETDAAAAFFHNDTAPTAADPGWLDRVVQDVRLLEGLLSLPPAQDDPAMLKAMEFKLAKLLDAQPLHADRQLLLARLQARIGADAAAMLSVQRALRANPNYVDAHRLRATLSAKAGDYDSAIAPLESLIAKGNDWPDLHLQIAQLQQARGRADAARAHVYSAIRINPKFERARAMLDRSAA